MWESMMGYETDEGEESAAIVLLGLGLDLDSNCFEASRELWLFED